jgi:hypothetical protein
MVVIEAARICYGPPSDFDAISKMSRWLDDNCRDWRFESGELPVDGKWPSVVVSAVFNEPVEKAKFTNLVTQQVRRWHFNRAKHSADNVVELSIDSYADGPLGHKMATRVDFIMADIQRRNEEQKRRKASERRQRMEKFAKVLAAVKQRAVKRKLQEALTKLQKYSDEAQGLMDAALEHEFKRRRLAEEQDL